jgi:proteasome lid subunit RPN8/RPN11
MKIAQELIDEIVAHSREGVPNECCGLVGGIDGAATRVFRTRNSEASPFRFVIHPNDQLDVLDQIESVGEELVAIYHSHTKSEAYPSQTDVNLARMWPDPIWLICSLADPGEPVVRGFEISDGKVREIDVEVT